MSSRFDNVPFEDFTELELESIFKKLCKDKGFIVHDSVSAVIRRRLSKRSGEETFGNARAVRIIFEKAHTSATNRWRLEHERIDALPQAQRPPKKPELEIIMTDVIGQRPSRDSNPQVPHELLMCGKILTAFVCGR